MIENKVDRRINKRTKEHFYYERINKWTKTWGITDQIKKGMSKY